MDFDVMYADDTCMRITVVGLMNSVVVDVLDELVSCVGTSSSDVFIDMCSVQYVSSYGIRALLQCERCLCEKGYHVHLKNVSDEVNEIFSLLGLPSVLDVCCL